MDLETPGAGLAIVTGAAGGLGSAIASRLGKDGFDLLLCDLDGGSLAAVAARVGTGRKVEILAADVASRGFGAQLLKAVAQRRIGAVVHCAGLSPSMADALRILRVNYDGAVQTVEAVRNHMAAGGCVVLIASISAYWPKSAALRAAIANLAQGEGSDALRPFAPTPQEAYHVSKRAVVALAAREAVAFGVRGARILSISPGLADTDMGRREQAVSPHVEGLIAGTPLNRFARADEIAEVAAFLCSPRAGFITGCDIRIDGGAIAALGF